MDKKKILVVDDELEMVDFIKMRLEAHNYDVCVAVNGEEGIQKAKSEKPDLIILDIMMPQKDGYAFVKEAKKDNSIKDIPIVVLTARPGMQKLFHEEGIKDYILKPFEAEELLETIGRYFEKSKDA